MQTHGGAAAETAILGAEREITISLRVDWTQGGSFTGEVENVSSWVSKVRVDRALSGSAPEEVLLVEGSAAAELEFTMGGDWKGIPLPFVFSPFNRQSPLYGEPLVGAPVEYDIIVQSPLGEFVYPQFRGFVRTITPDRADHSVVVTALDRAEILRKPVQLPPWAVSEEHVNYGELSSLAVYSSWVIDHCVRLCDVSPTPYRPKYREELNVPDYGMDGVQLWVTGNAGYLPTIGWLDNLNADTFPNPGRAMYFVNAPDHPQSPGDGQHPIGLNGLGDGISFTRVPSSEGYLHYWSLDRDLINPAASHAMGFTLNTVGGPSLATMDETPLLEVVIGGYYYLYIMIAAGQLWTRRWDALDEVEVNSARINIPAGEHIDVFAAWDNTSNTGTRAFIRARPTGQTTGGNQTGWTGTIASPITSVPYDQIKGRVRIGQAVGMSDIFYSTRNWHNATIEQLQNSTFQVAKYPAVIDLGMNRLSHMPYREAKDAWDIITEVASAEFGSVFFDENGVFRFWSWDRMLELQENPVRTLTLDEVSGLNLTTSLDSVRNVITIQAQKKRAIFGNVYQSGDPDEFYVPADSTKVFKIYSDECLSPLTFRMEDITNGDSSNWTSHYRHRTSNDGFLGTTDTIEPWDEEAVAHGYVVSFWDKTVNDGWAEDNNLWNAVKIDQYFSADGFLTVRVQNNSNWAIRLATTSGAAAYHMGGTKIVEYQKCSVFSRGRDSIIKYGARNLELDGDWYQDTTAGLDMIAKLRRRTEEPIPSTDAITIAGDPRLQLGDAITITDPEGFGDDMTMQILGISREWDIDAGLTDTLTVEMYYIIHDDPPVVNAGDDITDWTVGQNFTRVATFDQGDGVNVTSQWEIIAGPSGVGTIIPGNTLTFTPTTAGSWTFEFTMTTEWGSDKDAFVFTTAGAQPGGSGTPANPGEALWIGDDPGKNHFNIGIGQGSAGVDNDTNHTDWSQAEIEAGFSSPRRFFVTQDAGQWWTEFRINAGAGRTSTGTDHPRSELREFQQNGTTRSAWDGRTGWHRMKGTSRITDVTQQRPWVCFFQIHDASSDLIRVQCEGSAGQRSGLDIRARWTPPGGSDQSITLPGWDNAYDVGDTLDWEIWIGGPTTADNGRCRIWINGVLVFDRTGMGATGCYFKTGCYLQSNVHVRGEDPDDEAAVQILAGSLEVWHTGYPEPTEPVFTG